MFRTKYTITFIDSKWSVIKKDVKLDSVPRYGEYIFFDGQYHEVINVIHEVFEKPRFLGSKSRILVVINIFQNQENINLKKK